MVARDLVEWIYRLASSERENNPVCAQICIEVENGEEEPGKLATGYCIDRLLVDESKAWSGFYAISRYCQNSGLALAELRRKAPWVPECDFDSVEEQARKCIAVRKYIVSHASILAGTSTGPCFDLGESNARGRHPVYQQYLRDQYRKASDGE